MGPKLGEATDGVPWDYRVWFPVVALFRMAQFFISPLLFILNYIIGRKKENELVVTFEFKILLAILEFCCKFFCIDSKSQKYFKHFSFNLSFQKNVAPLRSTK